MTKKEKIFCKKIMGVPTVIVNEIYKKVGHKRDRIDIIPRAGWIVGYRIVPLKWFYDYEDLCYAPEKLTTACIVVFHGTLAPVYVPLDAISLNTINKKATRNSPEEIKRSKKAYSEQSALYLRDDSGRFIS